MSMYRRFIETNDHEGETWNFWLQVDGNTDQIALLEEYLESIEQPQFDPPFVLTGDLLDDHDVDVLVMYGDVGYLHQHNKLVGELTLPELFDPKPDANDWLYKGGLRDFFQPVNA